jgi:hypothetical protein
MGADLYISIVRKDGKKPVSKGMLVQSEWDDTIHTATGQAKQMIERSPEGSYVWAYGPKTVDVVPARTVAGGLPLPGRRRQEAAPHQAQGHPIPSTLTWAVGFACAA